MDNKSILIKKIIIGVCAAITVFTGIFYVVEMFILQETSYFTDHFAISISLLAIGVIALLLPSVNRKKFSNDTRGDNTMLIVAFLLFICSIISLLMSYWVV